MSENKILGLSIIVPVFNEEKIIGEVIGNIKDELGKLGVEYELIVINDGSTDASQDILSHIGGIKLINNSRNKGYGASLKIGVAASKYDWVMFFDGDGQHKTEYIGEFLKYADRYDMIAGARYGYKGPLLRQPGKRILQLVANYLAGEKIPDLNCGLRLMKKIHFLEYKHIFPDGFSLSTTSTLAFFKEGLDIKYVPVTIKKRCGKSTVKVSDGLKTSLLIIRLIMLFSPLKIFLPIAFIGFVISVSIIINDLVVSHFTLISKSAGFLFTASLLVFLFGLLADQVAAIRREMKK